MSSKPKKKSKTIKDLGGYSYNPETQSYIVNLRKSIGKTVVIKKHQHDAMALAYSNWHGEPDTIEEICRKFSITRPAFEEYRKIMGWTHDMMPLSTEDIKDGDVEKLAEDLLAQKKFAIEQKFNKKDWEITQKEALKWREFVSTEVNPIIHFLEKFQPDPLPPVAYTGDWGKPQKYAMLIGLNDIHFGVIARSEQLIRGNEINVQLIQDRVRRYSALIRQRLSERTYNIRKAVILVGGDILHSLSGMTSRGTPLETDVVGELQFELAERSCTDFLQAMLMIFPRVEVRVVKGNHAGVDEWILFKAISNYFRNDHRISFCLEKARTSIFMVEKTMVILDHGDSDSVRGAVVPKGSKGEAYIQSLILSRPDLLVKSNSRIFVQGHMHSFENKEYNDYEFLMFSTINGPDGYADTLNKTSRPRQNAVVLNQQGIQEVMNFYL